jgi:hypothetical protein
MRLPLSHEEIRRVCRSLVFDLDLLPPLDPVVLCSALSRHRGRQIKLISGDLGSTTSVGHLVELPDHDIIAVESAAPGLQRAHVIYHEVLHLVLDHLHSRESLTCGSLSAQAGTSHSENLYSDQQEWEAETGATVLSEMSAERPRPHLLSRQSRSAERGIAAAFGLAPDGWR